jgi:outer membrane protein assembly factor BamB
MGYAVAAATAAGEVALLTLDEGVGRRRFRLPSSPVCPPSVDTDAVYVNCRDGTTCALGGEGSTRGEVTWSVQTGWASRGLAVASGLVFAGTAGDLHAIDAESGEVRWSHAIGDWRHTAPAIGRDTLFVGGDRLWALDPTADGGPFGSGPAVRFEREYHGRVGPGPVLDDGTLYVVAETDSETTHLLALS